MTVNFEILKYYSRPDIQKEMLKLVADREIGGTFQNGSYAKRPDIITYPNDILQKVKSGIVCFHCSVERWKMPLSLSSELSREETDNLRKGWDLIIDLDAKAKLEHSRIAAKVVCDFLADFGISPTVKFSGRRGFHIGVAWEAFPKKVDYKETKNMYPEIPRIINEYITESIKDRLLEELIAYEGGVSALVKTVGKVNELNPYEFVDIEKEWGNRHLFRAPYSLNEKSGLISIPIRLFKLNKFDRQDAKMENVKVSAPFLQNKEEEATELLLKAKDWKAKHSKLEEKIEVVKKPMTKIKVEIGEEYFPPCIKAILAGLDDGKKRSIFTIISFLKNMNWDYEKIDKKLEEWNSKNSRPLPIRSVRTQAKWHAARNLLPANCTSDIFYKSIGICKPDEICKKIKNPVNYAVRKYKMAKKKH